MRTRSLQVAASLAEGVGLAIDFEPATTLAISLADPVAVRAHVLVAGA
eukprot:CAMPEP_0203843706 /NCGR_PEP_ID=MMETSP0359-20131031/2745_1 /ASSEMBLY_ACC=CAM_ASM_000338 /TAXON_ID=268821 /ORGANISM="Scrippsiella Hangoei, Strain SHTV-5" /LENGTH=47 /DNA_ID= /DNA_START= /DNA_END= /DNA_ORIENTATION=